MEALNPKGWLLSMYNHGASSQGKTMRALNLGRLATSHRKTANEANKAAFEINQTRCLLTFKPPLFRCPSEVNAAP